MLNQNLGDWSHAAVPPQPRILIPGCGTFQAVSVALQLPTAAILGVDLAQDSWLLLSLVVEGRSE